MSAYSELVEYLEPGETVEAIIFGPWGWGSAPSDGKSWDSGYSEPDPTPVPFDLRGKVLTLERAEPMMQTWRFNGGFGAPDCYAVRIYTDRRVIWVTQYDGATGFDSSPRNPQEGFMPDMPGG